MIPRWGHHEDALRRLAVSDVADGPGRPIPSLLLFDDDEAALLIRAREEGHRDGCDHLSEMAAIVAAHEPLRVVWSVPGTARHRSDDPDDPTIRVLVCSSAEHRDGGWHQRGRMLPYTPSEDPVVLGTAIDVEAELSPIGSLLDDVVRHPSDHDPVRTLSVLTLWGHVVAVPAERTGMDASPSLPLPGGGDRHRTHRLASELSRRHRPTAPVDTTRRPAVVTDLPPGWRAACPL